MRLIAITMLLLLGSCLQLIRQAGSDDPVKVKENITALVQAQRLKTGWMKRDECPADLLGKAATRRPAKDARQCATDPHACLSSCDSGDADSCYALARLIQDNDTIENDVADVLYRNSCRLGIVSGCTNSASLLFEQKDDRGIACGARTFEIACERDDPWACTMNGLALAEGIGRDKDVPLAKASLDKACQVSIDKNGRACTRAKELKAAMLRLEGLEGNKN